jgi:tetratricopeptide (TPR) repeat protein
MNKLLAVIFVLSVSSLNGQELNDISRRLDTLHTSKYFGQYYSELNKFEKKLVKSEECETLLYLQDKFSLLPNSKKDSLNFRKFLMLHGNRLKKCSRVQESQKFLLLAHAYVENDEVLDKLAYYIEKVIASNYARLDEYDKAIYYYRKVIISLNHHEIYELLSRMYSELGNAYK